MRHKRCFSPFFAVFSLNSLASIVRLEDSSTEAVTPQNVENRAGNMTESFVLPNNCSATGDCVLPCENCTTSNSPLTTPTSRQTERHTSTSSSGSLTSSEGGTVDIGLGTTTYNSSSSAFSKTVYTKKTTPSESTASEISESTSNSPQTLRSFATSSVSSIPKVAALSEAVVPTTANSSCSVQCPAGYIVGTTLCFLFPSNTSAIKSYQSALSYCQTVNSRTLISLEHLRDFNDLQTLRSRSTDLLYFANGGGSVQERLDKKAQVFNIALLTAMTSPIEMTVGLSEATNDVSAICVLPQYCNVSQCNVDSALAVLELDSILSSDKATINSRSTASVTCSYTKSVTTITCGSRGNMMPHPTTIVCEAEGMIQTMINTTSDLVASCTMCFTRGTDYCEEALDSFGATGYRCHCKNKYSMSTCWYSDNTCTVDSCNGHGACFDALGTLKCDCDWGYEGDSCEVSKDRTTNTTDDFATRLGNYVFNFPTLYGIQTTTWTLLATIAKSMNKAHMLDEEEDPQETHQTARAFFITLGSCCVLFFNDPYFLKLSQATCRTFFIIIQFCFMGAMIQWMLEGYNANQVVRCVHMNEWEKDFHFRKAWGIMAAPRMVFPLLALAGALAIIFPPNWYHLSSTWSCVGVICDQTTSVWLSIVWIVLCLVLTTAAFAESSVLLKYRRPLYNLKFRQRIERHVGILNGWTAEKCRRNTVLCFIGISLLSVTWLLLVLASDKRNTPIYGWTLLAVSTIYGVFSLVQGLYTDPNSWSAVLWFAMKRLPVRCAPTYDPISMWTRDEVKELEKLPKEQQSAMKEQMLPLNKRLFLHHKWNLQLCEKLETVGVNNANSALLEILRDETKRLHDSGGTHFQKDQLQETFAKFVKSVADQPPRAELTGVRARSEAVTLCAEKEDGTARVAKFMLVPAIDVFEPEELYDDADDVDRRRMNIELDKEAYKIAREEAVSQNNFMNSAIKFKYYGKNKA